ncbi:MAG: hypothetical protein V8R51_01790 [Clostridia bacterium]
MGHFLLKVTFSIKVLNSKKGKIDPDEEASFYWEATMYGFRDALTYHVPFAGENSFDGCWFFVKILKIYIQVCMIVQLRLEIKKLIQQSSKSEQLKLPGGLCKNSLILVRGNSIETTSDNENQQLFITKEFSFDYQLQDQRIYQKEYR